MTWLIILITVAVLAAITSVVSAPTLRKRIIGEHPARNALVPLFAAGLVWLANGLVGVVQDVAKEGIAPRDLANVLVEDITFGFPTVSSIYKERRLSGWRARRFFQPFKDEDRSIVLDALEAQRLNALARESGMLDPVIDGEDYSMVEIGQLLTPTLIYYEYLDWIGQLKSWQGFLAHERKAGTPREQTVQRFVDQYLMAYLESAGIVQAIVGMAIRNTLDLSAPQNDALQTPISWIKWEQSKKYKGYLIIFKASFMKVVDEGDLQERIASGKDFCDLLRDGSIGTLEQVFGKAAELLDKETDLIDKYVAELNAILAARTSTRFSLVVSVSNVGRYDTFFRKRAKVIVGAPGLPTGQLTIVVSAEDPEDPGITPYFSVRSRETRTIKFSADIPDDLSTKLHGAYASGLNYLKIGLLASAGKWEKTVSSSPAPFSIAAREKIARKAEELLVEF